MDHCYQEDCIMFLKNVEVEMFENNWLYNKMISFQHENLQSFKVGTPNHEMARTGRRVDRRKDGNESLVCNRHIFINVTSPHYLLRLEVIRFILLQLCSQTSPFVQQLAFYYLFLIHLVCVERFCRSVFVDTLVGKSLIVDCPYINEKGFTTLYK